MSVCAEEAAAGCACQVRAAHADDTLLRARHAAQPRAHVRQHRARPLLQVLRAEGAGEGSGLGLGLGL